MQTAAPPRSLLVEPERHALLPPETAAALGSTVIIAPHPDDESLGCGGLLALLADRGSPAHVIVMTDGSRSHPNSPSYPAVRLAALRERETLAALAALGLPASSARFLRYRDCGLPATGTVAFEEAARQLRELLVALAPDTLLVPWRRDPHCDHEATWRLLREATVALGSRPRWLEYPIWAWTQAESEVAPQTADGHAWRLDIFPVLARKGQAIARHRSQNGALIHDDPGGFVLEPGMLAHFARPWELFVQAADGYHTPQIEPKLSATGSLAPEYFDRLYAHSADPWSFETSPYEASKYAATLAALPRPRYANALELGCSIGVLTRQLAARCERLLGTDVSEAALAQARLRCADLPQITFERRDVSAEFPLGCFDLILVSEVGYYFSPLDLESLRAQIAAALGPRGHLLLVHYTGETNYPLSADAVHETFLAWQDRAWIRLASSNNDGYRLDLLEKSER